MGYQTASRGLDVRLSKSSLVEVGKEEQEHV